MDPGRVRKTLHASELLVGVRADQPAMHHYCLRCRCSDSKTAAGRVFTGHTQACRCLVSVPLAAWRTPKPSRSSPLEMSAYRRLQNVLCLAAAAEDVVSIYSGSLDNTIRYHCAQAAGRALAPDAPYETGHICARTGLALPNLRE